jgi:hypothetical protein
MECVLSQKYRRNCQLGSAVSASIINDCLILGRYSIQRHSPTILSADMSVVPLVTLEADVRLANKEVREARDRRNLFQDSGWFTPFLNG